MDFYALIEPGDSRITDGIWAAIVNGNYATPTADDWNLTATGNLFDNASGTNIGTVDVTFAGAEWSGQHWEADVSGTAAITGEPTEPLSGIAAGTYTGGTEGGTFTGAGTGTYGDPPPGP